MSGSGGMQYSALGPELYSGTCGMALFLPELYANRGGGRATRGAWSGSAGAFPCQ